MGGTSSAKSSLSASGDSAASRSRMADCHQSTAAGWVKSHEVPVVPIGGHRQSAVSVAGEQAPSGQNLGQWGSGEHEGIEPHTHPHSAPAKRVGPAEGEAVAVDDERGRERAEHVAGHPCVDVNHVDGAAGRLQGVDHRRHLCGIEVCRPAHPRAEGPVRPVAGGAGQASVGGKDLGAGAGDGNDLGALVQNQEGRQIRFGAADVGQDRRAGPKDQTPAGAAPEERHVQVGGVHAPGAVGLTIDEQAPMAPQVQRDEALAAAEHAFANG